MSIYGDAIVKIQAHILALVDVDINAAPDNPTEGAETLPMAISYIANGTATAESADTVRILPTVYTDIH